MNILLVVAEEPAVCESLRATVSEADLVLIEPSVEDALRRLLTVKADAIIVDDTPALGHNAVARMTESAPGTPVLALATRTDPESLAGLVMAGARETITKPFGCQELRDKLSSAIQTSPKTPERPVSGSPTAPQPVAITQHQTALRWLGRTAGEIRDPDRLSQALVDAVTDIFSSVRAAVLFDRNGAFQVVASQGILPAVAHSARFGFASGLMRWFEVNACLVDRATVPDPDVVKEMQLLGARLGVPIMASGRVAGAILLGERASGRDYTEDERELLSTVARCAAVSVENSVLYRDVAREQRRVDALLSNTTTAVIVVGRDKNISMMNPSAERILQLRAVDMVGRSVQKLGSGFADVVLRTLSDCKPRLRHEVHDAAINATLGLSASVIDNGEGVVVVFSKLPEKKADAEDIAYSPFWEFLASRVAQEIKNPLVAVNTFAQLLPRKYESEEFREAFGDVVQKEVSRINSVVETLFEFARHPRLVLRKHDMNETVRGVLKFFEEQLTTRSIQLQAELDPELPNVNMDPVFFSQAVLNVVQNSLEAMPSGGTLRVTTRRINGNCELIISDTGPGISQQDASMVFAPFFSTKEQGMGLGLTLANRIVRQHDGELTLVPNEEGGTAFAFQLPLAEVTSNADSSSD